MRRGSVFRGNFDNPAVGRRARDLVAGLAVSATFELDFVASFDFEHGVATRTREPLAGQRRFSPVLVNDLAGRDYFQDILQNKKTNITDVFIGVTGVSGLLDSSDVSLMGESPIIFALSNPAPEILPKEIKKAAGKFIFASGRPDFSNQINNIIAFPGVFRGLIDARKKMDLALELKIAKVIAGLVKKPRPDLIISNPFDKRLLKTIVNCIKHR